MSDTDVKTTTGINLTTPSLWTVVFLNDDFTPMQFVTQVLMAVFHKPVEDAQQITLAVHQDGQARVGCYTREVANSKVERTMMLAAIAQHPLQVCAERL